jgi:hypothetical protein
MFALRRRIMGLGLMLIGGPLAAQGFAFGAGAGFAHPIQPFRQAAKEGVVAVATVVYTPYAWPVGLRFDFAHHEFRGKSSGTFIYPRHRIDGLRLSAERTFAAEAPSRVAGWIFGGFGAYYDRTDRGEPVQPVFGRTYPGFQLGAAVSYRWGRLMPFFEAEYTSVWRRGADDKFFPILIGLRIGHGG